MFKAARWRSEKNRIKLVFKLQFRATQVPHSGWDTLMVSLVPLEVGKATVKSEKIAVIDGACKWETPIYETVKLSREPKSGKYTEKIYQFLVLSGSPKGGILGEVAVDFANYAETIKPSLVSLPLKTSSSGAVLHVTIQKIEATPDGREAECSNVDLELHGRTLKNQLSHGDVEGSGKAANDTNCFSSAEDTSSVKDQAQLILSSQSKTSQNADANGIHRAFSGSGAISGSSADSSSEQNTPKEHGSKSSNIQRDVSSFLSSLTNDTTTQNPIENERSSTEWSVSSGPDGSADDSTNSSEGTILKEKSPSSDSSVEKLKNDLNILARQAEVSELELQTLRKQIVKENRRGQELLKEICCLKEGKDAMERECEQLRASLQKISKSQSESGDPRYMLEEIRQELNYEKDLNANLRLQLQKTQEANSELILAVGDLEELLEQKNKESSCYSFSPNNTRPGPVGKVRPDGPPDGPGLLQTRNNEDAKMRETVSEHESEEDEEQHALDELVKQHDEAEAGSSIEQKILDLSHEIEDYKKDREELEMQFEQLALDYEILKQENHEMCSKLEQSELQEQLTMQYEGSDFIAVINELESHVKSLEKELEKQAEGFEADLEEIFQTKVEQEQRAIRAEESLRKMKWNNVNTAERLHEEFRRLSMQMSSTYEASEKLAMQAQAEASELQVQKSELEDLLKKVNEEVGLMKDQYEGKLKDILNLMNLKTKNINQLMLEVQKKTKEVENQKWHGEARERELLEVIKVLQTEIEVLSKEKNMLLERTKQNEKLSDEMERLKRSVEEKDFLLKRENIERDALKELNEVKRIKDENESLVSGLQSDMETLKSQYDDLKSSLFEDEVEKENLRKEVLYLRGDLRNKEDAIAIIEKKFKESSLRVAVYDGTARNNGKCSPPPVISQEKMKILEAETKPKEAVLDNSLQSFLNKEKDLENRIEELEESLSGLGQNNPDICVKRCQDDMKAQYRTSVSSAKLPLSEVGAMGANSHIPNQKGLDIAATRSTIGSDLGEEVKGLASLGENVELLNEMALMKERNKSMEMELKEMQERYSEISLKFAEVEGERQQLVMTIRSLKNIKKS